MIEIIFDNSCKEASAFGLTQWDKGQKLKIIWEDMPEKFQVHFSSRGSSEAIVTEAIAQAGEAIVDIPDALLKNSADIFVWIYIGNGIKVGESTKRGVLYVRPRAKPHTAIDDLEKTQQEVLESILGEINDNISHIKENGTESEYFPDYVKNQAKAVAKKVIECCNENTVVFLAASDAHLKNADYNSETAIRHMSQAMKLIAQSCPVDFSVYLGDMTSGGSDKATTDALSEMMNVNSALHTANCNLPSLRCTGSEDSLCKAYYRNGGSISSDTLYNLIFKWNKDVVYPENDKVRGYCYKDFKNEKLRVICLNTSDTHTKKLLPSSETATMSINQLQWLCETLDLSDKADGGEWRIVLLGHHPLDMIDKFPLALQVIEAYAMGESIDLATSQGESLAYNFAGKNGAVILGQFHGHLHNYRVRFITEKNIPLVAIPNAGYYDNNFYKSSSYTNAENDAYGDEKTYNKTENSETDTAFCVIVLDKATGVINAVHYGAGVDRSIVGTDIWEDSGTDSDENGSEGDENGSGTGSGGDNEGTGGDNGDDNTGDDITYVYTNMVPLSVTAAGNIYCGKGYVDSNAMNSAGEMIFDYDFTHTGFIPTDYNDVIRISGGTFDGTTGNYIFVYDSNKNLIWITSLTGEKDEKSGIEYTTSGVLVFTPYDVQTGNLENMAFIRVSTKGVGESLIVTVNEEIDGSVVIEDIGSPIVTYTNIAQYSKDKYGNPYGMNGCKNNYCLTETGEETQAMGHTCVGFLEIFIEGIIRVKGISFDGTEGTNLCLYDENLNLVRTINLSGEYDKKNAVYYEGSVMKFVPADATVDLSAMAYFRLSGIGTDSNLVITYCEEIN